MRSLPRSLMFLPLGQPERPWPFRNRLPTNHPRTSFQTRVLGTRSLRAFFVDGMLAAGSDAAPLQFLTLYALALGASAAQVGLIATASGLAAALALPVGVWWVDRSTRLKPIVLLGGRGGTHVTLTLLALLPLALNGASAVWALIGLAALRWFFGMVSHPAWTAMVTKVVPVDVRRLYISRRMLGMTVVTVIAAPAVGLVIGRIGGIEGYQAAFGLAAVLGFGSTFAYSRIEEPAEDTTVAAPRGSYREMLRDAAFRRVLAATFLLYGFTMVAGPFFAVYLVRTLGASPVQVGALAAVDGTSAVVGQALAGVLAVRFGSRRILVGSLAVIPMLPLIWWLIDSPWQAAIPNAIGGGAWAFYNLAIFNVVLELAPTTNVPRYAAAQQAAVQVASFVGPLAGTMVVASWGVRAAFLVSGFGRLLALTILVWPSRTSRGDER